MRQFELVSRWQLLQHVVSLFPSQQPVESVPAWFECSSEGVLFQPPPILSTPPQQTVDLLGHAPGKRGSNGIGVGLTKSCFHWNDVIFTAFNFRASNQPSSNRVSICCRFESLGKICVSVKRDSTPKEKILTLLPFSRCHTGFLSRRKE